MMLVYFNILKINYMYFILNSLYFIEYKAHHINSFKKLINTDKIL